MTRAILSPVTLADMERHASPFVHAYVAEEEALAELRALGRHLEAAAGHARHGAWWASAVERVRRSTPLTTRKPRPPWSPPW